MNTTQVLEQALQLNATEKFSLVYALLNSLDEPDTNLDENMGSGLNLLFKYPKHVLDVFN